MTINISVPKTTIEAQLKPRISVIGVGGAGGNAVNNMIQSAMEGCDFIVANTDAQALAASRTDRRIQLGRDTTQGLGAGAQPLVGRDAAEEAIEIIARELDGSHMAFITAGMGGGTGTGAAPVIARVAREMGVLTVGVVTKPFHFEGVHRMRLAEAGIEDLAAVVDTLIIIPNQNLFRVANEKTTFADAFKMADDVLHGGVRSVTDLMMMPGMINLDFADVRTVMKEMGRAMMGTGEASGERRALDAAERAIANPLLEDTSMKGAKGVLINITGGSDITLFEVDEAANRIRDEVESDAHIIFGSCFSESMEGKIRVSVVATGIEAAAGAAAPRPINVRTEARATTRRMPEIRTSSAAVAKVPVMTAAAAPAPAAAPVQAVAAPAAPTPAPAPIQTAFSGLGFGGPTLAPATGTVDLQAEEQALMEMAAAVRAELQAAAAPAPESKLEPTLAAPAPIAAQAAAVAEAVAKAPAAAPPRMTIAPRDVFIPKAAVEPKLDFRMDAATEKAADVMALAEPAPVQAAAPAPAPAPAKPEGRVSLFGRYRSLTSRPKAEEVKAPEPQAKAAAGLNISVGPMDRPTMSSHDEDELEIPAFLRRQAN
ncbi:MAG: cell division protein FtsZ [Rhodospirillaceae bacterium]